MNALLRTAALLGLVAAAGPALAADPPGGLRIGLGVAMEASRGDPTAQLLIPVQLTPSLRLEPTVGWRSLDTQVLDASTRTVGLGALYLRPTSERLLAYAGVRAAVIWNSAQLELTERVESSATSFLIGAVLGAELVLVPAFTVGIEGQLRHASGGDVTVTTGALSENLSGSEGTSTAAVVFLRAYVR